MPREPNKCLICGKSVKNRKLTTKFCSRECYFEAYRRGFIKNRRWFGYPEGNSPYRGRTSGSFKMGHPFMGDPHTWFKKGQKQWYVERGLPPPAKGKTWSKDFHSKIVMEELKNLRKQGFICVPIQNPIPDIVAFKNGKVYAVEVELTPPPDYAKYERIPHFFDDVIWIMIKRRKSENGKT
ncbi:MAG: hypothetical protein QW491_09510 [Thermoproteota archaeon]